MTWTHEDKHTILRLLDAGLAIDYLGLTEIYKENGVYILEDEGEVKNKTESSARYIDIYNLIDEFLKTIEKPKQ